MSRGVCHSSQGHLAPVFGSELLAEEQFAAKRGASQYADQQLGACAPCLKFHRKTWELLGTWPPPRGHDEMGICSS